MAAICPACGTANRPAAKFCEQCVCALPTAQAWPEEPFTEDKTLLHFKTEPAPGHTSGNARTGRVNASHLLPEGTEIEGFRILQQIGEGGFGIVYLAWDLALERRVAIKEYMPSSLAVRSVVSMEISMRSEQDRETFDAGLKSFVNEARLLARFDHPALVKVFRYWTANGTAYMAMPYYEGPTLKMALSQLGARAPEALLRAWLHPLLDALAAMHREQCYHRDISPDNILLTSSGPLLLDFGAARHVINDRTQVLTTMLKPGFAPVEQYGGTMLQGAWTDLYALAGVVHYAITGRPPVASVVRVVNDPLQPLALAHAGEYSEQFLRAIDAALEVRPESRPQDVAAFRALLDGEPQQGGDSADPRFVANSAPLSSGSSSVAFLRRRSTRYAVLVAMLFVAAGAAWISHQGTPRPERSLAATVPSLATAPKAVPPQVTPAPPTVVVAPVENVPAAVMTKPARPDASQDQATPPAAQSAVATPLPRAANRRPAAAPRVTEASGFASVEKRTLSQEQKTLSSYNQTGLPLRCSDLVLKSSLEPLNPEEAAFQKTRCKQFAAP